MAIAQNMRRWAYASLIGGAVAAASFAIGLIPSTNISGQISGSNTTSTTTSSDVVVTYNGFVVGQIFPGATSDKIEDVIAFPDQPAMLVRTKKALTLWVRQQNALRSLMEIPLDEGVNRVEFLEDGSTFVVLSKQRARVFALNKNITYPDNKRR